MSFSRFWAIFCFMFFFFFNDTATTEIYTLSLHDALPILWAIAICGPLALAYILRKNAAWTNAVAAVWVLVIGTFRARNGDTGANLPIFAWNSLGPYFWAGVGALGMVAWGLLERRRERINLGVAGFALTVIIFYFSNVMDKLGRS